MKLQETSKSSLLNKSTYVYLRWMVYLGQLSTVLIVKFLFEFNFNYIFCLIIIFISVITNLFLQFRIKSPQLNNFISTIFLAFDIIQLGTLFYLTGGITNPFILLIIIPAVFSSQYLDTSSSIKLVLITIFILALLSFFYLELPHPQLAHFHAPKYYLYSIPTSIFIGLIFLVFFAIKFKKESKIRDDAFDKLQEIMAKENELLSLGGQAAAAAHSLGTPLSTILITSKELLKEHGNNDKIKKDLDLLLSQSIRCNEILKKLSLNPNVNDDFISSDLTIYEYIQEIIRSFKEISEKDFVVNSKEYKKRINIRKSSEIIYGLRNFIGNANKFSDKKIEILLKSDDLITKILIRDDGPGFPKDLIDRHRLGEPYIRSADVDHISKYGLGLGTFIGKTLLERNFASINFQNSKITGGAEVIIKWKNKNFDKI